MAWAYQVLPFLGRINGNQLSADVSKQLEAALNQHAASGFELCQVGDVRVEAQPGCLAGLLGAETTYGAITVIPLRTDRAIGIQGASLTSGNDSQEATRSSGDSEFQHSVAEVSPSANVSQASDAYQVGQQLGKAYASAHEEMVKVGTKISEVSAARAGEVAEKLPVMLAKVYSGAQDGLAKVGTKVGGLVSAQSGEKDAKAFSMPSEQNLEFSSAPDTQPLPKAELDSSSQLASDVATQLPPSAPSVAENFGRKWLFPGIVVACISVVGVGGFTFYQGAKHAAEKKAAEERVRQEQENIRQKEGEARLLAEKLKRMEAERDSQARLAEEQRRVRQQEEESRRLAEQVNQLRAEREAQARNAQPQGGRQGTKKSDAEAAYVNDMKRQLERQLRELQRR